MNILIINYYYPPSHRAHAHRWSLIKKNFETKGIHVEVICGGLSHEFDSQSNVKRINFPFIANHNESVSIGKSTASRVSPFKAYIKKRLKLIYRKIFWPDGLWYWFFPVVNELYKRKNIKYDVVISYTPTFSSVLAGLVYKCINKNSKLIIDFGDPFALSSEMPVNNYFLYNSLNKFVEKYAFSKAHAVSLNNKMLLLRYQSVYADYQKFIEIQQIVDIEQFYEEKNNRDGDIIKVGYIGSLHVGIREPFGAIKLLNKVINNINKKVRVDFYGGINSIENIDWGNINYNGTVDRVDAIKLMKDIDVIINIENENCPMVPSKIFECMATGRPILNFLSSTKSSSFNHYPLLLNVDEETRVGDISEFLVEFKNKILSKNQVMELLADNQVETISRKYIEIVTQ